MGLTRSEFTVITPTRYLDRKLSLFSSQYFFPTCRFNLYLNLLIKKKFVPKSLYSNQQSTQAICQVSCSKMAMFGLLYVGNQASNPPSPTCCKILIFYLKKKKKIQHMPSTDSNTCVAQFVQSWARFTILRTENKKYISKYHLFQLLP